MVSDSHGVPPAGRPEGRIFTGRMALALFVGFFAVVFAVNGYMMRMALKTHSGALQGRIGLPIVMDSDLDERLPLAVEEVLYRIAQEALHNVVKHAGAHEARLVIHRSRRGVTMTITDDGKGFDPELVPAGHLGLAGMRARAERIGARFSCTSAPGRGTSVEVSVPGRSLDEQVTTAAAADAATTGDVGSVMEGSIRDG